jgi:lactobin A/cerein 7B family class IIb bacteriocin
MLNEMTMNEMQDVNGGVVFVIPAAAAVIVATGAAVGAALAGTALVITAVNKNTKVEVTTCPAP